MIVVDCCCFRWKRRVVVVIACGKGCGGVRPRWWVRVHVFVVNCFFDVFGVFRGGMSVVGGFRK